MAIDPSHRKCHRLRLRNFHSNMKFFHWLLIFFLTEIRLVPSVKTLVFIHTLTIAFRMGKVENAGPVSRRTRSRSSGSWGVENTKMRSQNFVSLAIQEPLPRCRRQLTKCSFIALVLCFRSRRNYRLTFPWQNETEN